MEEGHCLFSLAVPLQDKQGEAKRIDQTRPLTETQMKADYHRGGMRGKCWTGVKGPL